MVGEKLGSFRIDGTLGVGAMGVVYKATHEPTNKPAAVKVVNKEIAQKGKTYERFQREAEILKQFRHPNIVRFLALGRYSGTSYIAMEYIQGRTLEQALEERGSIPWQEVVELGIQTCDALHYAHEHGVVHRDLKPSNLMVTDEGRIKLTDFGIAKDLDKTALTATGRTLGTAAYMAPEQIRDTTLISHKTDLYALGVVLYQMLVGQPPFDGNSAAVLMYKHINETPPRPSAKLAEIPKALDNLVITLMAKNAPDRPWDAAAVGETLKKIHDKATRGEAVAMVWPTEATPNATEAALVRKKDKEKGPSARPPSPKREPRSDRDVVKILEVAGLVLALVAIAGFVAYQFTPPGMPYLYKKAETLMASADRHDWYQARDRFLEPLERRFPDNPHKTTIRDWRDRILLADVEARARVLQSAANTRLNQPDGKIEERFVEYYALASAAEKRFDPPSAFLTWEEFAGQNRPDEPSERPWHLLAKARIAALRREMEQRRDQVAKLLAKAQAADVGGRPREALGIRAEVMERYGRYVDLADLLAAPSASTPTPTSTPTPPPPASTPPPAPPPADPTRPPSPRTRRRA